MAEKEIAQTPVSEESPQTAGTDPKNAEPPIAQQPVTNEDQPAPLRRQDAFIFNFEETGQSCPSVAESGSQNPSGKEETEQQKAKESDSPQASQNVFAIGLEVVVKYKIDKKWFRLWPTEKMMIKIYKWQRIFPFG